MRSEKFLEKASKIFQRPIYHPSQQRTGQRLLSAALYGPPLKSHWPLRLKELMYFWKTPMNTEMPLLGSTTYASQVVSSLQRLPYPLSRVYRQTIGLWRYNRSRGTKRGESKITATNLGKIAGTVKKK